MRPQNLGALATWSDAMAALQNLCVGRKSDLTSLYEGQTGSDAERMQQRQRLLAHWQSCYNDQRATGQWTL